MSMRGSWSKSSLLITVIVTLLGSILLSSCKSSHDRARDIYVLVDVSGSYFKHSERSFRRLRALLPELKSGDRLTVTKVDDCSVGDEAEWMSEEVSYNPLEKGDDIRFIAKELLRFQKSLRSSTYTDITGAFLRASWYFQRSRSQNKILIIFSDLKEDTAPNCSRDGAITLDLERVTVLFADVAISDADSRAPELYMRNIAFWRERLLASGAQQVIEARGAQQVAATIESLRVE